MEDLPLGRIAALVPEFAVKDLPLGRTLILHTNEYTESSKYYARPQTAVARGLGLPAGRQPGHYTHAASKTLTLLSQFIFPVDGHAETLAFTGCDYCCTLVL